MLCLADSIAYGVYEAARTLGLRVPDDVSVLGYDDRPVSRVLTPPLSTFHWPIDELVETVVQRTVRAVDEGKRSRRKVLRPEPVHRADLGRAGPLPDHGRSETSAYQCAELRRAAPRRRYAAVNAPGALVEEYGPVLLRIIVTVALILVAVALAGRRVRVPGQADPIRVARHSGRTDDLPMRLRRAGGRGVRAEAADPVERSPDSRTS